MKDKDIMPSENKSLESFGVNINKSSMPPGLQLSRALPAFPINFLRSLRLRVRLSPFPRVETRFNTHNQNAFANAFLELLRLSSISQNHDYELYSASQKKKKQTLKQRDAVTKCQGVWL